MNRNRYSTIALLPALSLLLLCSCQTPRILYSPPPPCPAPIIVLPPFAIAEISPHDAQYFGGFSYLFSKGYYRAARSLLQTRAALPNLVPAVRDRLIFDWALADLHLGPSEYREGMGLLGRLKETETPYELRAAAQILLRDHRENMKLQREQSQLLDKLSQVKKTLKEFSNLEKSLK